jgi:hypothetical protein
VVLLQNHTVLTQRQEIPVAENHPIGVIAAQSIGELGTQLSLGLAEHRSGAAADKSALRSFSCRKSSLKYGAPKGEAYLLK